jgi:S-(hydroxymethyl)glutathione dehydrogenase/alcohol dehydrogenase
MSIPKIMKAAILAELNQPLIIDEVELPDCLDYGQVLVKIAFTGICGSQIGEIQGRKGPDNYLPHLLGHEASGTVAATGPGVRFVAPEDRVVLHWRKGNGIEAAPPIYRWRGKRLNAGFVTTFNEYAVVSENRVTKVDHDLPMDVLPLLGCAVTTGLGVVTRDARLTIGESVVVLGAGGVGLNIVQGAAMVCADPIIAVDLYDSRLALASSLGATHRVNAKDTQNLSETLRSILGDKGADVVIDNTGNTDMINTAYNLAGPEGRIVLVGVPKKGDNVSFYSLDLHFGKCITGSHGGDAQPAEDIPRYLRLYKSGKLALDELVTERYTLDEINTAIERMKNGQAVGRCLITLS